MIGLNPWLLDRTSFVILWLESNDCSLSEALDNKYYIKSSKIKRIFAIKLSFNLSTGESFVSGKWDGNFDKDSSYLIDFLRFIGDSYLVGYKGHAYHFALINESLNVFQVKELDSAYLLDVDEILEWVEDDRRVSDIRKCLAGTLDHVMKLEDKVDCVCGVFVDKIFPILRDGVK